MGPSLTPGRVLVTGGAGYVGSHVAWALVDAGWAVTVLDDLSTGFRDLVPPAAAFVHGAIGDGARIAALLAGRFDAVIHMAAASLVEESTRDPERYYRVNVADGLALLRACRDAGVPRFLFSSTAAVYGAPAETPVKEDAPADPVNPYGATKLAFERILADVATTSGMSYAVLRYFNVAGADPAGRAGESTRSATHLIKAACQHAVGLRPEIAIYGTDYPTPDGTCIRDYVHVADAASAHIAALRYLVGGGRSRIFNVGYGRGVSIREVLSALESVAGRPLDIRLAPRRPGDPPVLVAATGRLQSELGWSPRHDDLTAIVRSALDWERRQMA
jgi:UDP-glucose 4-epimerase